MGRSPARGGRGSSRGRSRGRSLKPAASSRAPAIDSSKPAANAKKQGSPTPQSYVDSTGATRWRSSAMQPSIMVRNLSTIEGAKYTRRPSKIARRAGCRRSTDVLLADGFEYVGSTSDWATKEKMPDEAALEDLGWLPGPIDRELPPFTGPTPGPTNPRITHASTEIDLMSELLTREFKLKCQIFTIQHVEKFRAKHPSWERLTIEKSFPRYGEEFLNADKESSRDAFVRLFDTWLAAKFRVAQLKPEVPASALWGHMPEAASLHDTEVDTVLTWHQFTWCNRHFSYAADVDAEGSDSEDETSEPAAQPSESSPLRRSHDTFRKRRELTDLACATFSKTFNPHQHLGLDEAKRSTKHWETQRISFKASVHSGTLVDMLSDCRTGFCMWFEERTWHSKELEGSDVNGMMLKLERATRCLVEKQMDAQARSTSNYCVTLDRGYGHVAAQERLWTQKRVYSNAMVVPNRVGLPRQYIAELAKDLVCPKSCPHLPDTADCRKFMWTVLHRGDFELTLWQDSQIILAYGNFFSGTRAGHLARATKKSKVSFAVWTPEAIWHYNVEGRSATDTADQGRRKLALAERRIERAGQKGIAFVFDVAFTNGCAMQRMLQPQDGSMTMSAWEHKYNKVRFCLRWAADVLKEAETFRSRARRVSGAPRPMPVSRTPSYSSYPTRSSHSGGANSMDRHVLVDLYAKAKAEKAANEKKRRGRPPMKKSNRLQFGRGLCAGNGFDAKGKLKPCIVPGFCKRPSLFCEQCRQYFHLPCFFKSHYNKVASVHS